MASDSNAAGSCAAAGSCSDGSTAADARCSVAGYSATATSSAAATAASVATAIGIAVVFASVSEPAAVPASLEAADSACGAAPEAPDSDPVTTSIASAALVFSELLDSEATAEDVADDDDEDEEEEAEEVEGSDAVLVVDEDKEAEDDDDGGSSAAVAAVDVAAALASVFCSSQVFSFNRASRTACSTSLLPHVSTWSSCRISSGAAIAREHHTRGEGRC